MWVFCSSSHSATPGGCCWDLQVHSDTIYLETAPDPTDWGLSLRRWSLSSPLQRPNASPGCRLCFWLTSYKSEIPTLPSQLSSFARVAPRAQENSVLYSIIINGRESMANVWGKERRWLLLNQLPVPPTGKLSKPFLLGSLRYADDTTLTAEREEKIKSFLMCERGAWKSWLKTQHAKN